MTGVALVLTATSALGCGVAAGVFFAFSAFVMPALADLPPAPGLAAMQSINLAATRPGLMVELFGTAAACLGASAATVLGSGPSGAILVLAGSAVYLVGAIGLTGAYHQPRNLALARVTPVAADAPAVWARYLGGWISANHARTAASLAAATLLTIGALHA